MSHPVARASKPETTETLIVGGGIIGLTVALELLDRGRRVTVIDAGHPDEGCSNMNAGWISLSIGVPLPGPGVLREAAAGVLGGHRAFSIGSLLNGPLIRWLLAFALRCNSRSFNQGVDALVQLSERTGHLDGWTRLKERLEIEVFADGMLIVCKTAESLRRELRVLKSTSGYGLSGPELINKHDLDEVDPALSSELAGALLLPDERHIEPERLMAALRSAVVDCGGDVHHGEQVQAFNTTGNRVVEVESDRESYIPDNVVLAAGVGTSPLAQQLGARLPIVGGKGVSLDFKLPDPCVRRPTYLVEHRTVLSPYPKSLRLAGRMEIAVTDEGVDPRTVEALSTAPIGYLADWDPDIPPTTVSAGIRPLTPDGLPIIGYLGAYRNVVVATGHQMLGVMLAPATASVTADLLTRNPQTDTLAALSPRRFLGQ